MLTITQKRKNARNKLSKFSLATGMINQVLETSKVQKPARLRIYNLSSYTFSAVRQRDVDTNGKSQIQDESSRAKML
jgi:hypothetical protein